MFSLQVMTQNVLLPVTSKPRKSGSELAEHYLPRGKRKPGMKQEGLGVSQTLLDCVMQGRAGPKHQAPRVAPMKRNETKSREKRHPCVTPCFNLPHQ